MTTWYAVYRVSDGALVSTGTSVADDATLAAQGLAKKPFAFDPRTGYIWNPSTLTFDVVAPPPETVTLAAFADLFTPTEREDLFDIRMNGTASQRKKLGAFYEYITQQGAADLGNAYIIDSVNLMESQGVIGSGRAAEILGG